MKLPDHFFRYFFIVTLILVSGIITVIIQTTVTKPGLVPLDHEALQARADFHRDTIMPNMVTVYPLLLFLNAGVALFILMIPLFWVWVWWFRRDLPDTMITLMQGTVSLLMLALGHNSFPKLYVTCKTLSWQMVATMYLPHALLEMLAFILAGTSAFLCIDALKIYLLENGNSHTLHPGDLCLFILGRTWKAGFLIFFLMAIAAAIECWVTPVLVESAFKEALLNMG
ncbi:MAG: hypothetical protein EHM53_02830 [Methanoregulaceae archaeon]|nr:MAG: hypothetical protein EHM53_02830 [Methanoregulaceae archaeon]